MGSEDQERGRRHNEEPEVEAHQHGFNKAADEPKELEDKGDDEPDVEAHLHGFNK